MSLEQALAENTAALTAVAALLRESNEGRAKALATVEQVAGAVEGKKPKAPKPTAAAESKPTAAAESKPAAPGVDAVRDAAKAFVGVEDAGEREERKKFMRTLIDRFNVPKNAEGKQFITDVAEQHRQSVIDAFTGYGADAEENAGDQDEDDIG